MTILLVPAGRDGERIEVAAARMTGLTRSRIGDLLGHALGRCLEGAREPAA